MGYNWVTNGLQVTRGLQVDYELVTRGLQGGYKWDTSGLPVGYDWVK